MMQAYGCKEVSGLLEIRQIVRDSSELVTFVPKQQEIWRDHYSKFCVKCGRIKE